MKKGDILELQPIEEDFPRVWIELYEREFTMPFLYHYYYRSNSSVRKYLQYYKRPYKALELLGLEGNSQKSILDIGCDWGYLLMLIKKKYPKMRCFGLDIDSYSCEFGMRLAKANSLDIELRHGNARKLPFGDNVFDYIVSTGTFEHILPQWRSEVLSEMSRTLKPGGRLVVLFPNASGFVQRLKDFISERTSLTKYTQWLPNFKGKKKKTIRLPHSKSEEDVISITDSETLEQFVARLKQNHFSIEDKGSFVFMIEIIPNWLIRPTIMLERFLETNPLTRSYCTTLYFSAVNRKQKDAKVFSGAVAPGN